MLSSSPPPPRTTDGFRKIPIVGTNGANDQRTDLAQFYHVNFMRGQEQRLSSIKRKVTVWLNPLGSSFPPFPVVYLRSTNRRATAHSYKTHA